MILEYISFACPVVRCDNSTTPSPSKPVFPASELLQNLTVAMQMFEKKFELTIAEPENTKQMTTFITELRNFRHILLAEKSQVIEELSSLQSVSIIEHLYLESVRITLESNEAAVSEFAFEILGFLNGVSQLKSYYISDTINIEIAMMQSRFTSLLSKVLVVETDVNTITAKRANAEVVTEAEKKKTTNDLIGLQQYSVTIKSELYRTLLVEEQKATQAHDELSIVQKMNANMHIKTVDWLISFLHTYKELVDKLMSN